jgi:hypothetical protein
MVRMLLLAALGLDGLAVGGRPATGCDPAPAFSPEREDAALGFVREHYPELASLLDRLKPMNRDEYEKAIVELDDVREALAKLQQKDPERSDLALRAWKARSQVELLVAQLARTPSRRLEKQLRQAVRDQIEVELLQQRYERDQAEARLRKLNDAVEQMEKSRDRQADARYEALVKKAQRSRTKGAPDSPTPPREPRLGGAK